jgi:hypothetical protein
MRVEMRLLKSEHTDTDNQPLTIQIQISDIGAHSQLLSSANRNTRCQGLEGRQTHTLICKTVTRHTGTLEALKFETVMSEFPPSEDNGCWLDNAPACQVSTL